MKRYIIIKTKTDERTVNELKIRVPLKNKKNNNKNKPLKKIKIQQ